MSQKRVKMFQIESLRMSINEYMALVREDISCVVNERLSSVEQFMCSLFQSELETLETLMEREDKLLDVILQPHVKLHGADQCMETSLQVNMSCPQPSGTVSVKLEPEDHLDTNFLHLPVYEEVSPEQQEMSPSLVQEEPEPPHIYEEQEELLQRPEEADGSTLTSLSVKSEDFLHLSVYIEEVSPEQQERSPSLVQEEPEPPHIKEEQEQILQRPEEADGSTLTLLAVKSEGDDENIDTEPVASTSTEHMKTQAVVVDCGTSQQHFEGDRNKLSKDVKSSKQTHSMRRDTGKKGLICTHCGNCFSNKIHLKKHMMTHAGGNPFACTVCGKCCVYRSTLKIHMMTHTGEFSITCKVCGKGFSQMSNLKMHMWTHTAQKPFKCTVCSKGYAQRKSFKRHMMTHAVEKPHTGKKHFTCTVCGKGCFDLKSHMMTHTGEWPFACIVCGKGLAQMTKLKRHMRIHTGEKPFTCTVCGKGFAQNNNLKTHMRRMHAGGKSFTVCGDN